MTRFHERFGIGPGDGICYSGYREGQSPAAHRFPSVAQVEEDLRLLAGRWRFLRLYDCGPHAETVLEVIARERLDLQVMLGVWLDAEVSNPGCPWGGVHSDDQLAANRATNQAQVDQAIRLALSRLAQVIAVSAGNESTVDWTDHLVPAARVAGYVRQLKAAVPQPVTFCDNYVPWLAKLGPLAAEVDFISLHTYPVWEGKTVDEAMAFTIDNYRSVADRYPQAAVAITEAGWTTRSGGGAIAAAQASEDLQATYVEALLRWSRAEGVLTFVFEAFDEPWKGAPDPGEPEMHWGLYTVDRSPKRLMAAERLGAGLWSQGR